MKIYFLLFSIIMCASFACADASARTKLMQRRAARGQGEAQKKQVQFAMQAQVIVPAAAAGAGQGVAAKTETASLRDKFQCALQVQADIRQIKLLIELLQHVSDSEREKSKHALVWDALHANRPDVLEEITRQGYAIDFRDHKATKTKHCCFVLGLCQRTDMGVLLQAPATRINLVKHLARLGANVNGDRMSSSPLCHAAINRDLQVLVLDLLQAGADPYQGCISVTVGQKQGCCYPLNAQEVHSFVCHLPKFTPEVQEAWKRFGRYCRVAASRAQSVLMGVKLSSDDSIKFSPELIAIVHSYQAHEGILKA